MPGLTAVFMLLICCAAQPLAAATISGTVVDASGNPVKDVRIDHTGKVVVVPRPDLKVDPSPDEIRTDAQGHFRATTDRPAIVVRKPGYISQRLVITGDAQVEISLQRLSSTSREEPQMTRTTLPPGFTLKRKAARKGSSAEAVRRTRGARPATPTFGSPRNIPR
jgi:hypothetical protein